ncbi:Fe-S cluster assembly protein HesB [Glutamicibacter nicotianae]|uniref:Fe-S cluster assembly protein HesB n=1 Tax=Glutamicibacter nicotianae TaxID=37929 RepID=UPI00195C2CF5|nr:Fe-S cluster assembly protein HesB [Glutamicibacter nicotianae]MBM7769003.1 Fe-S cluster assembly iron-binding protein IscA [Glutamicibacter nicotianae]
MLALTDQAASIVTAIVTNQAEEETAGLRIMQADSTHPEDAAFGLQIVPAPESTDGVVDTEGSPVYVDEAIADALEGKVLDAAVDEQGGVSFQLLEQG